MTNRNCVYNQKIQITLSYRKKNVLRVLSADLKCIFCAKSKYNNSFFLSRKVFLRHSNKNVTLCCWAQTRCFLKGGYERFSWIFCTRYISFKSPSVVGYHPYTPFSLISLFNTRNFLMVSFSMFVSYIP